MLFPFLVEESSLHIVIFSHGEERLVCSWCQKSLRSRC